MTCPLLGVDHVTFFFFCFPASSVARWCSVCFSWRNPEPVLREVFDPPKSRVSARPWAEHRAVWDERGGGGPRDQSLSLSLSLPPPSAAHPRADAPHTAVSEGGAIPLMNPPAWRGIPLTTGHHRSRRCQKSLPELGRGHAWHRLVSFAGCSLGRVLVASRHGVSSS